MGRDICDVEEDIQMTDGRDDTTAAAAADLLTKEMKEKLTALNLAACFFFPFGWVLYG